MTQQFDAAKAQAFGGRVVGILNSAALSQMIVIGHKTRLLDVMSQQPAATSQAIADAAGLNERYVREWLGAMVTGGIIDYDASSRTYHLPPEHAASLTRAAGPGNLAVMVQMLANLARVEDQVVDCFHNGGGVPYSEYPLFQEQMREQSAQVVDATLIDVTLPLVPGLPERLARGIDVADVGCGAGHAINVMGQAFPNSRFVGYDFSPDGLALGRVEAAAMGLKNVSFESKDAATLDGSKQFDLITIFDAVHDQAHPARMLQGVYDALKPGGDLLCVDIAASSNLEENTGHPAGPVLYAISTMHCMTVSLAYDGDGLGTVWGEQKALSMLAEAGFKNIAIKKVEGDHFNNYYLATK